MRHLLTYPARASMLLALVVLSACAAPATPTLLPTPTTDQLILTETAQPTARPTADPNAGGVVEAGTAAGATAIPAGREQAVRTAVVLAASALNVAESEVSLQGAPLPVEWSDTSLGCPQPDTTYTPQIIPGYLVTVNVAGEPYNIHTDLQGNAVMCFEDGDPVGAGTVRDPIVSEFILRARGLLAAELAVPTEEVVLVSSEAVSWNSSALGCALAEDAPPPTEVATPGYRIVFAVEDVRYFFHTDQQRMIRCDDPVE